MSKFLLTADIHIGEYNRYNPSPGFREGQFIKLAERLVEVGMENDCDDIIIAGDFLKVPVSNNRINHLLFKFVRILCKGFSHVYWILGNHDISSKSQSQSLSDTIISLINDEDSYGECDNFMYMDHQTLESDGKIIAFQNWLPKCDVTWASDADIIVTHYTHAKSGCRFSGQKLVGLSDNTKLFIFGDIHHAYTEGRFVSIGTPIQGNLGDQTKSTAVVLDTESMTANHVDLDPDHTRFMRMMYTQVKDNEGFHEDELVYRIYRPKVQKITTTEHDYTSLKFDDVDELINRVVVSNGLVDIHSEVLSKNPEFNSIDFNFRLISLDIKGYRSIKDFHIDFDSDNKELIVLVGQNGSGKSSVLSALKSVFMKNRYMQEEKSDLPGCTDFYVNVKFMYGGKFYEVQKGDKSNIFYSINGEIHRCNITQLESELETELPWIKYLDLLFISSDSPNLADKFSESRRITLIKRFYRLDRLDAFKDTATKLYNEVQSERVKLDKELIEKNSSYNTIKSLIDSKSDINVEDKYSILSEVESLMKLQEKVNEYNKYIIELESLKSTKSAAESVIESYRSIILSDEDISKFNDDIRNIDLDLIAIKSDIDKLNETSATRKRLTSELNLIMSEGSKVRGEIDKLKKNLCPTCNQLIDAEKSKMLIEEKEVVRKKLLDDYNRVTSDLDLLWTESEIQAEISKLNSQMQELMNTKSKIISDINNSDKCKPKYDAEVLKLAKITLRIDELTSSPVEEVKFSSESSNRLAELNKLLADIDEKVKLTSELDNIEVEINKLNDKSLIYESKMKSYADYIEATSGTGLIMSSILTALADNFNSEEGEISYKVTSGVYRNKPFLTFNQYMDVKGKSREYSTLSSGQKIKADIDFLNRLMVNSVGLLVADEWLKYQDDDSLQELQKSINDLNANTIIISTHDSNFTQYSRRFYLELNSNGETIVSE